MESTATTTTTAITVTRKCVHIIEPGEDYENRLKRFEHSLMNRLNDCDTGNGFIRTCVSIDTCNIGPAKVPDDEIRILSTGRVVYGSPQWFYGVFQVATTSNPSELMTIKIKLNTTTVSRDLDGAGCFTHIVFRDQNGKELYHEHDGAWFVQFWKLRSFRTDLDDFEKSLKRPFGEYREHVRQCIGALLECSFVLGF